jgi:hypothetical protein
MSCSAGFPAVRQRGYPGGWYPHPELNGDQRFRKPLLYPFELWGQGWAKTHKTLPKEWLSPPQHVKPPPTTSPSPWTRGRRQAARNVLQDSKIQNPPGPSGRWLGFWDAWGCLWDGEPSFWDVCKSEKPRVYRPWDGWDGCTPPKPPLPLPLRPPQ